MFRLSLSSWLFLRIGGFLFIVLVGLAAYLGYSLRSQAISDLRQQVHLDLLEMRGKLAQRSDLQQLQPDSDHLDLNSFQPPLPSDTLYALRPDGYVLFDPRFGAYPSDELLHRPEFRQALAKGLGFAERYHEAEASRATFAALPVEHEGQVQCVLYLVRSHREIQPWLTFMTSQLLLPLAVVMLLAFVVSCVIARTLNRTGRQLTAALDAGEHAQLTRIRGGSPLDDLARAINQLLARSEKQRNQLRREASQWEAMFTTMREGILAVDQQGVILTMNRSAAQFLGLTPHRRFLGKRLFSVHRNADLQALLRNMVDGPAVQEQTVQIGQADGLVLRVSAVRFSEAVDGQAGDAVLMVLSDITPMKRLETMREEFVANVSHELKTPIAAILGAAETLMAIPNAPKAERFVAMIDRQSHRMQAIIQDLLMLSRLEQAEHWATRDFSATNILATVEHARTTAQAIADEKQVVIELACEPCELPGLHRLLENAIMNLLTNAVHYSPEGGRIQVQGRISGETYRLAVCDQGPGIAAEHQAPIFERFYRVDKSRDRQTGGTGLGLAIVRQVATMHRGSVCVESTLGKGATFVLQLPLELQ